MNCMNLNPTITEYYQLISSLGVNNLILYYFYAYFFISLVVKFLKQEIDLKNFSIIPSSIIFSMQQKALLTLSFFYIFKSLLTVVNEYADLSNYDYLIVTLSSFLLLILFLRVLFEKMIFQGIMRRKLVQIAKSDVENEQRNNNRKAKIKRGEIKKGAATDFKINPDRWYALMVNLFVVIIIIVHVYQVSGLSAIAVIIFACVHMYDYFVEIKKSIDDYENGRHGSYIEIVQ